MISLSDTEDEPDQYSSVQAPFLVISRPEDSEEEEEEMSSNKGGTALWALMAARGKGSSSKDAPKT